MNILEAIRDENLFRHYFGESLKSWRPWFAALRTLYGLPLMKADSPVIAECTGRDPTTLPSGGFDTALFLTGRRSGKSRIAAVIGAFEAVLSGREKRLSPGEKGVVPVLAPTRRQSQIVKGYLRAIFDGTPLLQNEVIRDTQNGFDLRNGVSIEVLSGDWRTVRGFTLLAAIVDEAAFFGLEDECKIRSDTELIRAIKPSLATVGGRLVAISSPYAKRGWCYQQHKKHFGNDSGRTLVWNCPSRTMNPTLLQEVVDDAMEEDRASALSEYMGQFRDDVAQFVPRALVEGLVKEGRRELLPRLDVRYFGFADLSGGRGDDATLAIAHVDRRRVVLDFLKRYRPPFNPQAIIGEMADELRRYRIRCVTGDNYAAEFVAGAFRADGIRYVKAEKNKSALYLELLPRMCSDGIELLDDPALIDQLCNLERRTRSGGKDVVDHPQGSHDDLANSVAGVANAAGGRKIIRIGAF